MARAKKTASVTSTAPKTRGIDLQEIEARVTALDKAKRRSYDIFDIEQRVYNLEKNGGGGGGSSVKIKTGTFTSSDTQYGVVTVSDVGFKPDLLMVFLPISDKDTCSYWEKSASWAATSAIWSLAPAEARSYLVTLGRETGETGIQAINDSGFSFMANGWNTLGVVCKYVAVSYGE